MLITSAQPYECQEIRQLEEKAWGENVTSPYDIAFYVRFGYVFVAKVENKLVGVIIALKTKDDKIKVTDLVVDDNYRRRGIARELYLELLKLSLPVIAFVNTKNEKSMNLHLKLGFKQVEEMEDPFYLGKKEKWVVMEREE